MIPDFDSPISRARHEDLGMKAVPLHRIDSHVMSVIRVEELIGVGLRALVHVALFSAHQKDLILGLVEVKTRATAERGNHAKRRYIAARRVNACVQVAIVSVVFNCRHLGIS